MCKLRPIQLKKLKKLVEYIAFSGQFPLGGWPCPSVPLNVYWLVYHELSIKNVDISHCSPTKHL